MPTLDERDGAGEGPRAAAIVSPGFTIRPARPEDEPELIEIQHSSGIHHATIDPERWQLQSLEAATRSRRHWHRVAPRSEGLVAVANGRVIGMIELWLKRPLDPDGARTPHIKVDLGLAVAPDWRGHGVGTALMLAAEDWARAQGAERMVLDLAANNAGAQRLYDRLDYEVEAIAMDKRIEPDPAAVDSPDVVRNRDGQIVPTLRGDGVLLRPLVPSDREALHAALSDASVAAVGDTRGPETSVDELLAGDSHWTIWAIEVDGEFAGSIQAAENDDEDYRSAGIDIFLSSRFQGRGLGTDSVRTLARYLIRERGHHRLTIDPAASNARAIRTYEKIGFKPVGVMRRYERGRDGTFHDGLLMDLLADDLR